MNRSEKGGVFIIFVFYHKINSPIEWMSIEIRTRNKTVMFLR